MANIKSSKKAIKVIAKKTLNNHEPKAQVKNLIKDVENAINDPEYPADDMIHYDPFYIDAGEQHLD